MRFGLICIIAGLVSLLQASKIENEKEEEYDAYIKKKLIPPSARKKNMKIGGDSSIIGWHTNDIF